MNKTAMSNYLFVYGTLKRRGRHPIADFVHGGNWGEKAPFVR